MEDKKIRDSVKKFYNENASYWSTTRQSWWNDLAFIKDYLKEGGKLLDFGCGNGRLLELINSLDEKVRQKIDYQGVDISSRLLNYAQEKYPKNKFKLIEREGELPFPDDSFDLVFSIAVFHHFSPKMAESALIELKRVLKQGGLIFLSGWCLRKGKHLREYQKQQIKLKEKGAAFLSFHEKKADSEEGRYYYRWELEEIVGLAKKIGLDVFGQGNTYSYQGEERNYYIAIKKV